MNSVPRVIQSDMKPLIIINQYKSLFLLLILLFLFGSVFAQQSQNVDTVTANSDQLKLIHRAALLAFILPVLNFSFSQAFDTRYLIYSLPIFIIYSVVNLKDLFVAKLTNETNTERISQRGFQIFCFYLGILVISSLLKFKFSDWDEFVKINIPINSLTSSNPKWPFVMSNQSIATLSTDSYALVKLPPFPEFYQGDNSLISKIIIYNDNNCAWDNDGDSAAWQNKDELSDRFGNKFVLSKQDSFYETLVFLRVQ